MQYFKEIDHFSASIPPYIHHSEYKYKSKTGAVSSIIIYSLALIYFAMQLYKWQTNQFLPIVVQSNKIFQDFINFPNSEIVLNFNPYNDKQLKVFDVNNLIIYPVISYYCQSVDQCDNNQQSQYINITVQKNKFIIKNLNLSTALKQNIVNNLYIEFQQCNESDQSSTNNFQIEKCASDKQIRKYLNGNQWVQIQINYYQYNIYTKKMENHTKSNFVQLQYNQTMYNQINAIAGLTSVDDGLIFAQQTNYNYLYSSEIQTYTTKYQKNAPIIFDMFINQLQYYQDVQYPLLGQILADTGSITSLLFTLSFFVQLFNQKQLNQFLIDEVLGIYFPQYKEIIIKRNLWDNKLVKLFSRDNKKQYESEKIVKIYEEAQKIAIQKLNVLNIVYELSRIQFILQSIHGREIFQQAKEIGIELPLEIVKSQTQLKKDQQQQNVNSQKQQIYHADRPGMNIEIQLQEISMIIVNQQNQLKICRLKMKLVNNLFLQNNKI